MELTQNKIDLINKLIKNNRKYVSNEDLYEDFFNETCIRSAKIFDVVDSDEVLESYVRKIVSTAIINVLKDNGRLRRSSSGYVPTKEIAIDEIVPQQEPEQVVDYSGIIIKYSDIEIPESPEDILIQKDFLQQIVKLIEKLDADEPEKQYLQIYLKRYSQGMTQNEISLELGLSQSEISKRLYKLMDNIKNSIE